MPLIYDYIHRSCWAPTVCTTVVRRYGAWKHQMIALRNLWVLSFPEVGSTHDFLCFSPKSLVAKGSVSLKFTASWAAWDASASFQRWGIGPQRKEAGPRRTQETPNFWYFYNLTLHSSFPLPPPPLTVASILLSLHQEITVDEGQGSETGEQERIKVIVAKDGRGRGSSQNFPCFIFFLLSIIFGHICFCWTKTHYDACMYVYVSMYICVYVLCIYDLLL